MVTLLATIADVNSQVITNMICLGSFFLLCPGEHTYSRDNTPFKLQDVKLYIGNMHLAIWAASDAQF